MTDKRRQCEANTTRGMPCQGVVPSDSEESLCAYHARSDEERRAWHKAGAAGRAEAVIEKRALREADAKQRRFEPPPELLTQAAVVIDRLLRSTLDGTPTGEPDTLQQAWGVILLTEVYRAGGAERERIREVLRECGHHRVADEGRVFARERLESAREALREGYKRGEISLEELPLGVLTPLEASWLGLGAQLKREQRESVYNDPAVDHGRRQHLRGEITREHLDEVIARAQGRAVS